VTAAGSAHTTHPNAVLAISLSIDCVAVIHWFCCRARFIRNYIQSY